MLTDLQVAEQLRDLAQRIHRAVEGRETLTEAEKMFISEARSWMPFARPEDFKEVKS